MAQEARIFYQEDCNLSLLEGKTIAIIGYGSQGHEIRVSYLPQGFYLGMLISIISIMLLLCYILKIRRNRNGAAYTEVTEGNEGILAPNPVPETSSTESSISENSKTAQNINYNQEKC